MQYLLMIYSDPSKDPTPGTPAFDKYIADFGTYTEGVKGDGSMLAGEALQPVQTATSVRVRDGKVLTTDGPFAETKEHLGGFYMIEAPDLDAAVASAARIPTAKHGTIEVRPLMVWDQ